MPETSFAFAMSPIQAHQAASIKPFPKPTKTNTVMYQFKFFLFRGYERSNESELHTDYQDWVRGMDSHDGKGDYVTYRSSYSYSPLPEPDMHLIVGESCEGIAYEWGEED